MTTSDIAGAATDLLPPAFHFSDEHRALREVLRQFFGTEVGESAEGWRRLLDEVGVDDLLFGAGESCGTAIDLAILAEEAGAALFRGPLVSTAAAGPLLAANADSAAIVALLRQRPRAAVSAGLIARGALGLSGDGGSRRVSGAAELVWDLDDAGPIVCAASIEGTESIVVLNADEPGVAVTELSGLDPSRGLGRIECRGVTPELVLTDPVALAALRRRADLVVAAELLGVAQHAFDQTLDYVSRRIQFGRTIGSFQAIKHRLADLLTQVELTRSAVYGAAWQLAGDPESRRTAMDLAVAAALAADTAAAMTKAAVQLHGGIAITWEHWAHRYLRRAHSVVALTGGAAGHRRRLAELVDLEDGERVR
ncbi:acyl-CoA dehydrogenase family protein [Nocardia sp. XZ_19_385]|uniref:acyl-CoA dehydrogenase family protein n=1 Tax=Nocardia sp. XZ_19_385 TaxID=2769488 RepID=UPI00188ECD22|nr:acyl-CoA dehydrogenase family protein [Nocardia sp. XZ_19_385]